MKKTRTISKKTAKQLVKNYNRRVARENKAFEKLPPSEKRVAIARDVLAQLRTKRLIATPGIWLTGGDGELFTEKDVKKNPELKDVLAKRKQCEGCALGGMFMCAVERADKLKLDELDDVREYREDQELSGDACELGSASITESDAFSYLKKFFDSEQLEQIETAFERGEGACSSDQDAMDFCSDEEDASERMRLIMENIVVNKGKFCPWITPEIRYYTAGFEG